MTQRPQLLPLQLIHLLSQLPTLLQQHLLQTQPHPTLQVPP
jgi:hypothetical protein